MSTARAQRLVAILLVVAAAVWLGMREHYYSRWMDDDAFISFRYARSLVHGHGLTFNPDERVEGYTNFLWTLLLALAARLGADIPAAAQWLGITVSYLTLGVLFLFARRAMFGGAAPLDRKVPVLVAIFALLLLALSESWAVWAVSGLENVFSAFVVTLGFWTYFRALETGARRDLALAAALLCLGVMSHPSNGVFLGVVAAHVALQAVRHRERRGALGLFALTALGIYGPYFGWRLVYYGHLFPNTYYAKVGLSYWVLARGLEYFAMALRAFPLAFAAWALLPVLLLWRRRRDAAPWLLFVAVLLYSLYVISIGGEAFPAFRSLMVLLPLLCLVAQYELHMLFAATRGRDGLRTGSIALLAIVFLLESASFNHRSPKVRILDTAVQENFRGLFQSAALLLKSKLPPDTYFAHSGAGIMAYYTEFRFLDTLGLTDAHIGMSRAAELGKGVAGHEKGDGLYVLSRRPDCIMFSGFPITSEKARFKGDVELFSTLEFRRSYELMKYTMEFRPTASSPPKGYEIYFYRRIGGGSR